MPGNQAEPVLLLQFTLLRGHAGLEFLNAGHWPAFWRGGAVHVLIGNPAMCIAQCRVVTGMNLGSVLLGLRGAALFRRLSQAALRCIQFGVGLGSHPLHLEQNNTACRWFSPQADERGITSARWFINGGVQGCTASASPP
jgi:hypothetical protein